MRNFRKNGAKGDKIDGSGSEFFTFIVLFAEIDTDTIGNFQFGGPRNSDDEGYCGVTDTDAYEHLVTIWRTEIGRYDTAN